MTDDTLLTCCFILSSESSSTPRSQTTLLGSMLSLPIFCIQST